MTDSAEAVYDLLIVGAGINGAGLARDAAGRGLRVLIVEQDDIAGATSSASTKLIHGGLRYLEHREFGLVRESLAEREALSAIAPHLVREQRFVIPHSPEQRPRWMIRLGLALYDGLARGSSLKRAQALALRGTPFGTPLRPEFAHGFAYSDLATDDARLTLLNVFSAAQLGAQVRTRTTLLDARRDGKAWRAVLQSADGTQHECAARILVNAGGPWAARLHRSLGRGGAKLRLVRGSHIVLPRLYEGEQAYLLQNEDGRIVFVIPFEGDFSLVGTTESTVDAPAAAQRADTDEIAYLCGAVGRYFAALPDAARIVWSFSGIRGLFDDGADDASAVSRECKLLLEGGPGEPPLLSVFGGKLTTYRHLAERVLDRLRPWLPGLRPAWSARVHLPGGGLGPGGLNGLLLELARRYPKQPPDLLHALARRHGTLAARVLGQALTEAALGEHFGGGLYAAEVDYLVAHEWARTAEDILWRRTKCGLRLDAAAQARLGRHVTECLDRARQAS